MLHVYKILHGIDNIENVNKKLNSINNKGSLENFTLKNPDATQLDIQSHFFLRVINDWNSLPESVVSSRSILNAFKTSLN